MILSLPNKGCPRQRRVWALLCENHSSARCFPPAQLLAAKCVHCIQILSCAAAPCPLWKASGGRAKTWAMSQIWKCFCAERNQHPTIPMAVLSLLAGAKLVYQREKEKGKSSATSHFPGSFKIAEERYQCGRSEASGLGSVGSAVAFPLLPLSGVAAVPWIKGEVPRLGLSTAGKSPAAPASPSLLSWDCQQQHCSWKILLWNTYENFTAPLNGIAGSGNKI